MNKVELEIVALSHSITQSNSYAVVLGEINGNRRLPIVIGGFEASAIAVALEKIHHTRPLTHDLLKNLMLSLNVDLQEIIITDMQEGVFYSKLVCVNEYDTIEIDSRTSDAIAMAVRFNCAIFIYDHILDIAGISMVESNNDKSNRASFPPEFDENNLAQIIQQADDLSVYTLEQLEKMLEKVLELEDYMKAIAIRDELNKRKDY